MNEAAQLRDEALQAIAQAADEAALEAIEVEYLGRREGKISKQLMSRITQLPAEEKAMFAKSVESVKKSVVETKL